MTTTPTVQATRYLVTCLPENHSESYLFTVRVDYRGNGLWTVQNRTRLLGTDGTWSFGFAWSGGDHEPATEAEMDSFDKEQAEWIAAHRFDEQTALRLAAEHAPRLKYRDYGVAEALAETTA